MQIGKVDIALVTVERLEECGPSERFHHPLIDVCRFDRLSAAVRARGNITESDANLLADKRSPQSPTAFSKLWFRPVECLAWRKL